MSQGEISLVEVSPRDGLQNETRALDPAARAELIARSAKAGARRIEAVSFVNPKRVPQMAGAEEVMALSREKLAAADCSAALIGLVLNARGFERACAAQVDEINFVVVASETFNQRNQGVAIAETMRQLENMVCGAGEPPAFSVTIGASFGCPFEGETDAGLVADLAAQAVALGAGEIALADTIGVASPLDVTSRVERVREAVPDAALRCHFHNTRNTGIANAYAAYAAGVRVLDASTGGIGGCPFAPAATGNVPTEDLVYMFERMGVATGMDIDRLCENAAWLDEALESTPPGMVWRAGGFPGKAS